MALKIGDKVRFLNEVGGGRITSVISEDIVNVETNDGFEVPTRVNNLIFVNSPDVYESGRSRNTVAAPKPSAPSEKKTAKPEEPWFSDKNQVVAKDDLQFLFALVPEVPANPPTGNISMYLVNNCNDTLLFRFAKKTKYNYETVVAGSLSPNSKTYLGLIKPEMIAELPVYCFQLLNFRKRSKELESFLQKEITLSAVKFYKQNTFVTTRLFKVPVMLIQLNEIPLKAELEKLTEHDFQHASLPKEPQKKEQPISLPNTELIEVDLHIHELLDNHINLTNAEMLTVQMNKFHEEMDNAIKSEVKKIVFIHGVGNGTLKNELRRELQRKYSKYNFQDASFREYGYGATMVIIRK
ncbi:MAG: DUF2027 domain-containing protein [Bacteroidia bacterium]|nr:DUF2027 domain-containing protein [Bacteroidia bacterium]